MAILTFALGAVMILAGLGSLWGSLNLVPTEMGLLYGVCGVVLLGCGAIVLAIAALIARLDRLVPRERKAAAAEPPHVEPKLEASQAEREPAPTAPYEPPMLAPEEPAEAHDLAPPPAVEPPAGLPKATPYVIGRYAAGGANYAIYSDGTIEAETEGGAMRFATMTEFRAFIADRKR